MRWQFEHKTVISVLGLMVEGWVIRETGTK